MEVQMSNYNKNQKTVYIPDYLRPIWERMIKESGKQGAGYILLEAWCKIKGYPIPEYQSKGDKSKKRRYENER